MQAVEYLKNLFSHIPEHIVAAIILGLYAIAIQAFRNWYYLKRKYNGRTFHVFYKGDEKTKVRQLTCKVKRNKLVYEGTSIRFPEQGDFTGEIIMNLFNLRIGEGYHYHHDYNGFNFPKLIIKDDDTFLVETSYKTKQEKDDKVFFTDRHQAFVWKRQKKR